jgi:hypothetical protein
MGRPSENWQYGRPEGQRAPLLPYPARRILLWTDASSSVGPSTSRFWVRIVQDWVYHICFVQTFSLPFPPLGIPHHARPLTRTTPAAIGVKG